jgi:hypothetical protein
MTIAIGFWANDGVLLCADTQLSVGGGIKTYDGKIHTHILSNGNTKIALGVVGSGDVDYIRTAADKITHNFPVLENSKQIASVLEERWLDFFNKHIAPWAYFPRDDRPSVELLIAVNGTGKKVHHSLYYCSGTAFHTCDKKAIGVGVMLADDLISRYTFGNYKVSELGVLGIYIVAKVKRSIEGCGGRTHFAIFRKDGDISFSDKRDADEFEAEILDLDREEDKKFAIMLAEKPLSLQWLGIPRRKKSPDSASEKS